MTSIGRWSPTHPDVVNAHADVEKEERAILGAKAEALSMPEVRESAMGDIHARVVGEAAGQTKHTPPPALPCARIVERGSSSSSSRSGSSSSSASSNRRTRAHRVGGLVRRAAGQQ